MPTHVITVNGNAVNQQTGDAIVPVYQHKTILTDAQIKALPTSPVIVVPAVGSGKVLYPMYVIYRLRFEGGQYTNLDAGLDAVLTIGQGVADAVPSYINSDCCAFFQLAVVTNQNLICFVGPLLNYDSSAAYKIQAPSSAMQPIPNVDNQPLAIAAYNNLGNFTGGNAANTLEVTVFYSIVDL